MFAKNFVANAISLQQLKEVMRLGKLGAQEEAFIRSAKTANHIYKKRHKKTYLQQIRENTGMEIKELAEQTGISETMIVKLEGIL